MTTAMPTHAAAPATDGNGAPRDQQQRRAWFRFRLRPTGLPLVLLLLALSTLFLLGNDREYFYRGVWHDRHSAQALVFAENLSFRHYLVNFYHQSRDADGNFYYHPDPYNRFPMAAYALLKPVSLLFGDTDFKAKIYAGRMLMLLLFSSAALLAYHSLARIIGSRWDALTATLLAFSSFYVLFYADKISNEVTTDLFGAMLLFHGMVIFVQEGRFQQLLVKSGLALLLGWHSYAFLMPFVVFGLASDLLKAHQPIVSSLPLILLNLKQYAAALLCSRYLILGIVALLFGSAVLGFNFAREYIVLDGEVAWRNLPSLLSAVRTTGNNKEVNAEVSDRLTPITYLRGQSNRIATMMLPYALNPDASKTARPIIDKATAPSIALGIIAVGVCLTGVALAYVRRRPQAGLLLATLTFSGFCWAAGVRTHVYFHEYESVFYIGIPLTAFAGALLLLRRFSRMRLAPGFAVAALLAFIFSVSAMAGVGQNPAERALDDALMTDYAAIRNIVDDSAAIFIPSRIKDYANDGVRWSEAFYLSGKTVTLTYDIRNAKQPGQPMQPGDYLLLPFRQDNSALLTPDNRHIFLYDWTLYDQWRRTVNPGRPIIAEDWHVYFRDGRLIYASSECANRNNLFFLHLIPQDTANLRAGRQEYGYDSHDFSFRDGGITLSDETCVIARPLPRYDIAAIRTGQYTETGPIWQGEYRLTAPGR